MFSIPTIRATAHAALSAQLQHKLNQLTKPVGALGELERVALRIGLMQQSTSPQIREPQLVIFAGDHGLARLGASAYPQDVTWQMVLNMLGGGAAANVLARQHGIGFAVLDCGVAHNFDAHPKLIQGKIAHGTQASSGGTAMSAAQCDEALALGARTVTALPGNCFIAGEMGIGNTAAASLMTARLLQLPIAECTGRGTGLDDAGLARKIALLELALKAHSATEAKAVLAAFGGFEIAAMTGAYLQAASQARMILVDGFICTAALLVAARLNPAVLDYCIFTHRSSEPGHLALLKALHAKPLLELGMRLGEGSGALAAYPLVQSALLLLQEMASFESAGVSGQTA
jgi:nicotinate-nucleotide--dimethylbenzimidazole phosphoribosyltransferase